MVASQDQDPLIALMSYVDKFFKNGRSGNSHGRWRARTRDMIAMTAVKKVPSTESIPTMMFTRVSVEIGIFPANAS